MEYEDNAPYFRPATRERERKTFDRAPLQLPKRNPALTKKLK